jgi:hypothetical protein
MGDPNGLLNCQFSTNTQFLETIRKVEVIHTEINRMGEGFAKHLPLIAETNKMMCDNFGQFCEQFDELKKDSFAAAVGKAHVPTSVFFDVVGTLCFVILAISLGNRYFEASTTGFRFNAAQAENSAEKKIKSNE